VTKNKKFKNINTGNNRQTIFKNRKPFVHVSYPATDSVSQQELNLELEKRAALIVQRLEDESSEN
jgi:hypothetical protein